MRDPVALLAVGAVVLPQARVEAEVGLDAPPVLAPQRPPELLEARLLDLQDVVLAGDLRQRVGIGVRQKGLVGQLGDAVRQVGVR